MTETAAAFYASLVHTRAAAGALIRDPQGRALLVEPTYKDHWEVPGGVIEKGETPVQACQRECREELGVEVKIGRLLVVEYKTDAEPRGDSVMFVYDGGICSDTGAFRVARDEIRSFGFFAQEDLTTKLPPGLARRLSFALEAVSTGSLIELENGSRR